VYKSTQTMVSRILQITIGTGALTATVAIVDLALFLADYKRGSLFMTPCAVLGKLYSNSMMVLFNSRISITRRELGNMRASQDSDPKCSTNIRSRIRFIPNDDSEQGKTSIVLSKHICQEICQRDGLMAKSASQWPSQVQTL